MRAVTRARPECALQVVQGDVTSAADVTKVFEGDVDQVVIALGGAPPRPPSEDLTLAPFTVNHVVSIRVTEREIEIEACVLLPVLRFLRCVLPPADTDAAGLAPRPPPSY